MPVPPAPGEGALPGTQTATFSLCPAEVAGVPSYGALTPSGAPSSPRSLPRPHAQNAPLGLSASAQAFRGEVRVLTSKQRDERVFGAKAV